MVIAADLDRRANEGKLEVVGAQDDDQRLRLLADTSRAIADASLDIDATLVALAQAVVPGLADDCIVFLVEDDASIRRVAEAAVDPAHVAVLRALREHPRRSTRATRCSTRCAPARRCTCRASTTA